MPIPQSQIRFGVFISRVFISRVVPARIAGRAAFRSRFFVVALAIAIIALTALRPAPAQQPSSASPVIVTVIIRPKGGISIVSNQSIPVTAEVAVRNAPLGSGHPEFFDFADCDGAKPRWISGENVWWTAQNGSFVTFTGSSSAYTAPDFSDSQGSLPLGFAAAQVPDGKFPPRDNSAKSPPATQISAAGGAPKTFDDEINLAQTSAGRDSRVEHLQKAVLLRPNDPQNLLLEFKIATLIGQNYDPELHQAAWPQLALPMLESIAERYDHKAYYSPLPADADDVTQTLVPRALILAASGYSAGAGDQARARKLLLQAMRDIHWTFDKRRNDWSSEPRPGAAQLFNEDPADAGQLAGRIRAWEQRQGDAAAGNVLGENETILVRAAVVVYGQSFGPKRPLEIAPIMQEIIKQFPGTPIAREAQRQIDRAAKMASGK